MHPIAHALRAEHRFLAQRSFYPLALASLLASVLLLGQVWVLRSTAFLFLGWNLLLAWIPYLCSLWVARSYLRHPNQWWRLAIPAALWLAFFPNAPYLVTDFVHLPRVGVPTWWYGVAMLASLAWAGCLLTIASLHTMRLIGAALLGPIGGWAVVLGSAALGGVGLYLGRLQRWNSWDLLRDPRAVLYDALWPLLHPRSHVHEVGFVLLSATLLLVCYASVPVRRREP